MLNFLLDIAPDKSQLLSNHQISRDIAGKETRGKDTIPTPQTLLFTPVLYDKGIRTAYFIQMISVG